jgi:hypothetical protein
MPASVAVWGAVHIVESVILSYGLLLCPVLTTTLVLSPINLTASHTSLPGRAGGG